MRDIFQKQVIDEGSILGLDFAKYDNGVFVDIGTEMCYICWKMTYYSNKKLKQAELDNSMVDTTSVAMKLKMAQSRAKGKSGWETCSEDRLKDLLLSAAFNDEYVDACNYAGMLIAK